MGRPLSPPEIHWKIIWTLSKFHKTTSERWQRTPGTQKDSPISLKGGRTKYRRRQWHPTPVLLPGKSHGWRSLEGCSPWGCWGSDITEWLPFHFSLSCIGEGNGNPLQCSRLENPRDRGAWWAAIYGVSQSWTRLKRLSSSSSNRLNGHEFEQTLGDGEGQGSLVCCSLCGHKESYMT